MNYNVRVKEHREILRNSRTRRLRKKRQTCSLLFCGFVALGVLLGMLVAKDKPSDVNLVNIEESYSD